MVNELQVSEMLASDRRSLESGLRRGSFTELWLIIEPKWPSDVNIFDSRTPETSLRYLRIFQGLRDNFSFDRKFALFCIIR